MMKKLIFALILFPFFIYAQEDVKGTTDTTDNKIIVSEDVNDCINRIHDNPAVIKLLIRNLAKDREKMREVYKEIIDDPEMVEIINEIKNNIRAEEKMKDEQY
jgi:hypothetical protein